jgi:hypothetical protein
MRTIKTLVLHSALIFLIYVNVYSQSKQDISGKSKLDNISFAFSINRLQDDFGLGVNATTPFIKNSVAFKLGVNLQWLNHVPVNETHTTWTPYFNIRFGALTRKFIIEKKLSIYGEGGMILLLPNSDFSKEKFGFGGYGLFGFEFTPANWGYFIELGGAGTGAQADKLVNSPIYSNGFLISTGMRIYF